MRLARSVVLPVLALALVLAASAVRADVVKESATLSYSPGSKKWDFSALSASGYVNIDEKSVAKKLTKLKDTGLSHSCFLEYDTDSRIEAINGNYYSVFGLSKCDQ